MKTNNKSVVKFTIVAMMMGFLSPSVEFQPSQLEHTKSFSTLTSFTISLMNEAEARPARRVARRTTRRTVNRHSAFYRGGGYYHGGVYHPVARWSLVALGALAIGSVISSSSMSSSCTDVPVHGITYKKCDGTYFEPYYDGDSHEYKVVVDPH